MFTIADLRAKYLSCETTPQEVVLKVLREIKERDTEVNAFLAVYDDALAVAETATKEFAEKKHLPLYGIPLAIKNNILIKGKKATAASLMLENYTATYDATLIKRLKEAGAILVGATNLDEFAMGGSTENSAFCITRNPLDHSRVPGGSSGGSAAAVALGVVPAAIGTDTGGSIRQPASFCGLVGFKPTYGAVSRYGLIAMGSSLDQAGPLTNTVSDAEVIHEVMKGLDSYDATTITSDTYAQPVLKEHYTFGVPRDFMKGEGIDADVLEEFWSHVELLKSLGHTVVDVDLPLFEQGLAAYYIVVQAEISSNLARFDGMRYGLSVAGDDLLAVYQKTRAEGFGKEVKRRILLGTYILSSGYYDAFYGKAEQVRSMMRSELNSVFNTVDFILTPTAPTPAFKLGEQADPVAMYKQDIFTVPVNLTGVPALSFPMGKVLRGGISLPVGVQYIAPHGQDAKLFSIGKEVYDARL